MPLNPRWEDIALRLALASIAGAIIGWNRGGRGRAAGLRTTILVCLAAAVSMIQANLLLATAGKGPDSFVVLDLMRLPLGILSGIGFIGGGAILKRGNLVMGVTTAATLWFVTVMGLCFGGGQIELGLALLAIAWIVLSVLKKIELSVRQERRATLSLSLGTSEPSESAIRERVQAEGFRIGSCGAVYDRQANRRELIFEVNWCSRPTETHEPKFLDELIQLPEVLMVKWCPEGAAAGPE